MTSWRGREVWLGFALEQRDDSMGVFESLRNPEMV